MSHDLASLGITSQNLTPNNPSLDATPLFQAALNYIHNHPVQTLTLDPGAYYLLSNAQSNDVLVFPQLSNVTVDLAGSTLYFTGPLLPNGIELYYCANVTFKNFQLDYIHPPYTHVRLTSVDAVKRILTYQALPGYADPSTFNPLAGSIVNYWAGFFRNGAVVPGTSRTLISEAFTNNQISIQDAFPWAQSGTLATLQAGDTVVVAARGGGPPLIVWESSGVTLSNITIYGAPTWAVQLYQSDHTTVDGIRVVPRPGYGLVGSDADGIHFFMAGAGNTIRNCYVTRTMDDAIIMESPHAAIVASQASSRQITVTRNDYVRFPNGSLMNFVDRTTTLESTGGIIVSQSPADSTSPVQNGTVTLTFDRDLPALSAGTIMAFGSAADRGQGSVIEDNLVEDTYGGRGVWLGGVEGVTVQRNVLRRTSEAAVVVANSTESVVDPDDAGPPAHDITITDNAIEQSLGPQAAGAGLQCALAGIQVVTAADPYFVFPAMPSNTDITIQNNYIADSARSGIWIGELNRGLLQNNLIVRSSQNPTFNGVAGIPAQDQTLVTQDALIPVAIQYSSGITEINDAATATSTIAQPVSFMPSSITVPMIAGTGSMNVQTAVSGFNWSASSDSAWLTIMSAGTGSGAGTVQFSYSANDTGAARTGNIIIAGVSFAVTQTKFTTPLLSIAMTHQGTFAQGRQGASYTITVSNEAGAVPTSGTVTLTDTVPSGLAMVALSGTGWTCATNSCTRSDTLAGGASYPPVTVTVNVSGSATSPVVNAANVSGGGSPTANTTDTTIVAARLGFFAITPCRAVDTRSSQTKTGPFGPPSLGPSATRDFPLLSSGCGLPGAAQAYSLNLTVIPPEPVEYLSVWPAGQSYPGASTLNSPDGATLANAAIVSAGTNSAITVMSSNATDLIVDANGYFAPPNGSELAFYPVRPCRVADTRTSQRFTGSFGPPSLASGAVRDFPIQSSACNIPSTAVAYSLNMTAVPQAPLPYLSAWPTGEPYPNVSTLNANEGSITANAAIVPAGTPNGSIRVMPGGNTDLIIDVNGYFGPPDGVGALHFYAVTPCRVADTRASQPFTGALGPPGLAANLARDFPIAAGACGIPATAQAFSLNMTVVPQGPLSYLSVWPTGQPYPNVSTLNSPGGTTLANAAIVAAGTNGSITVLAGNPTDLIIDINGYFAP